MAMALRKVLSASTLQTLAPSFVANIIWPDKKPNWKLHPTSYLDGLRGLASFIVFFCHYTENNHGYFVPTYGQNGDDRSSAFIQLPWLRIIYSGRPMVHIFFVISGFVLSYKPLKCIHTGAMDKIFPVLASSTFRRPIRLFLPCVASTFMIVLLIQSGLLYQPLPSFWEQFWNWTTAVHHKITWPWDWDHELGPPYDIHLWTIPIEFNHSMLLFLGILCMARLRLFARLAMTLGIMFYAMSCAKWATFEFFSGMFLAEIHVMQSLRVSTFKPLEDSIWAQKLLRPAVRTAFHIFVLIIGFYVGGWPNQNADKAYGIAYLNAKTPTPFLGGDMPQRFWFGIFAVLITWSCGELPMIRRFLEGGLAQYCGRLSYAIYIVHGPALEMCQGRVIGLPHVAARGTPGQDDYVPGIVGFGIKGIFGHDSPTQQIVSWFVGLVVLGPLIVWWSDLFWRLVDAPIVTFGRTLENLCLAPPEPESKELEGHSMA